MAITPRHIPHLGTLIVALLCTCASSGCRTLTIPWEHPMVFKKTPACDSAGACNQGCYVPPPPVMNSDCYGYRFTCWSPWPEDCQPQCNEGCETTPVQIAPTPAELPPQSSPAIPPASPPVHTPEMPPVEPMTPVEAMPETAPATPQSSFPSGGDRQTAVRNYAPQYRSNSEETPRGSAQHSPLSTPAYSSSAPPDYRFRTAAVDSPSERDSSIRTTRDVPRAYQDDSSDDRPSKASATSQNTVERFRW
jgi:hypothetical protein